MMTPERKEYLRLWRIAHPGYMAEKAANFRKEQPKYYVDYRKTKAPKYDYNRHHNYYVYKTEAGRLRAILL